MSLASIQVDQQSMRVRFDRFDLENYELFLRTKALPESTLTFDWQSDTYTIEAASRFAGLLGVEAPKAQVDRLPLAEHLFDYQRWIVEMALDAKRFATWIDTGLGKMAIGLEWARQVQHVTKGRVLFVMPLAVISQYLDEAERFYGGDLAIVHLASRAELRGWCEHGEPGFGITNYEKFLPAKGEPEVTSEIRYLSGIVLDESSALKTGGGKIKWALIKSCRGIEYKLSCTATPAPNEAMEYASQAAFLEKLRTEADILWTWFQRDKYGVWSIKPHAHAAFFAFMASWSIYMRDPAAFGFNDILASLPAPDHHEERIEMTADQRTLMTELAVTSGKGLFADHKLGVKERSKFAQMARGFIYQTAQDGTKIAWPVEARKPARVAEIATEKLFSGRQGLVWTAFDEEGEIILREMHAMIDQRIRDAEADEVRRRPEMAGMRRLEPDIAAWQDRVAILTGSQAPTERQAILDRFRSGEIRCLISKPSLIGYGLNLQFVTVMVFSGIDDSMERRYQAIRRAYRFGQKEPVQVWTVYVPELEGVMFDNVSAKEARFLQEVAAQERHYRTALGMEAA